MQSTQPTADYDLTIDLANVKAAMSLAGPVVNGERTKAQSRDLWQVSRDQIHRIEGFNVRAKNENYFAKVRAYADSMKAEGFYQHKPLACIVEGVNGIPMIKLYDGYTRLDAVDLAVSEGAEITTLPVVIDQRGISREDLTVALVVSNTGNPLTTYETAIVCKRLARYGMDNPEICRRLGFTPPHVANLLTLVAAPLELQKLVSDDVVSATTAINAIAKYGSGAFDKLNSAKETAKAAGKERVTERHIDPNAAHIKAVKRSGPALFEIVKQVKALPGFDALAAENVELYNAINDIIESLK